MTRNSTSEIGENPTASKMETVAEPILPEEIAMAPWADPVQTFFEDFEGFVYDPDAAPAKLFDELAQKQGWTPGSSQHREALERLETAQFRQFDPLYGNPEKAMDFSGLAAQEEEELTPAEWAFIQDYKVPLQHGQPAVNQTLDRQLAGNSPQERTMRHLDTFFAEFPTFERNRTESVSNQLKNLRKKEGWWGDRSHLWDQALRKYQNALVLDFNAAYGSDENNMENWHRLFSRIPGAKLPDTIDECKSLARSFNFNLVDLVEANAEGRQVFLFDSKSALHSYTKRTKKFFPRKHASAGGLLSYLLQQLL